MPGCRARPVWPATWADLAHESGISAPAVAARVQRLTERGVIVGFSAVLDPRPLAPAAAVVTVRSVDGADELARWPEVVELRRVAAEDDLHLTVRFRSPDELDGLVGRIAALPGVARVGARVVLDTVKGQPGRRAATDRRHRRGMRRRDGDAESRRAARPDGAAGR